MASYEQLNLEQRKRIADTLERIASILAVRTRLDLAQNQAAADMARITPDESKALRPDA